MHRPTDGGAVAPLAPRGLLGVVGVLVQARVVDCRSAAAGRQRSGRHRQRHRSPRQATVALVFPLVALGQRSPLRPRGRGPAVDRDRPLVGRAEERRAVHGPGFGRSRISQSPRRRVLLLAGLAGIPAMQAHHQVVAGPGAGDVQQPEALMGVHLLVDRLPRLVVLGLDPSPQPHHRFSRGVEGHRRPAGGCAEPGGHARQDHDGELEALGGVNGEDAHAVVVGLGQDRLGHPGVVGALQPGPRHVVAQVGAAGVGPGSGLIDHEPEPPPHVAWPPAGHCGLEGAALPDQPVDQGGRAGPALGPVEFGKVGDPLGHRVVRRRVLGQPAKQREPAPASQTPVSQVVVAAAVERGAQGGDQGQLVGGVGHSLKGRQHVSHLAGAVHQRGGLGPVGDPGRVEGVLEAAQAEPGRDEDGDVPQPGRPGRRLCR